MANFLFSYGGYEYLYYILLVNVKIALFGREIA